MEWMPTNIVSLNCQVVSVLCFNKEDHSSRFSSRKARMENDTSIGWSRISLFSKFQLFACLTWFLFRWTEADVHYYDFVVSPKPTVLVLNIVSLCLPNFFHWISGIYKLLFLFLFFFFLYIFSSWSWVRKILQDYVAQKACWL